MVANTLAEFRMAEKIIPNAISDAAYNIHVTKMYPIDAKGKKLRYFSSTEQPTTTGIISTKETTNHVNQYNSF